MSDVLERHLEEAFTALDAVSVRDLEATAELLECRRDGLGRYASIFPNVAGRGRTAPTRTWHGSICVRTSPAQETTFQSR
jgi:hypothetical protein